MSDEKIWTILSSFFFIGMMFFAFLAIAQWFHIQGIENTNPPLFCNKAIKVPCETKYSYHCGMTGELCCKFYKDAIEPNNCALCEEWGYGMR